MPELPRVSLLCMVWVRASALGERNPIRRNETFGDKHVAGYAGSSEARGGRGNRPKGLHKARSFDGAACTQYR